MASSKSEDDADTWPERPARIQPYQFKKAYERIYTMTQFCVLSFEHTIFRVPMSYWVSKFACVCSCVFERLRIDR